MEIQLEHGRPVTRWLVASVAVGVATVVYRTFFFNGFENDHYMHLAWAQQILRGAVPVRDFVEPGWPLMVALSAFAQLIGPTELLAEFALSVAMLALTAGLTCWVAARFSGSILLGVGAAALQIAIFPRFYNYPKLLVPLVGLTLMWRYLDLPTLRRAAVMGAWIALGFLFRHDYLLYLTAGAAAALLARHRAHGWRTFALHTAACAATAFVVVLPYLAALTAVGGLRAHIADAIEFARGDVGHWLFTQMPRVTPADPLSIDNATAVLFFGAFALPAALVAGTAYMALRRNPRGLALEEAKVLVLAILTLAVGLGLIRHPIAARLPDAGGLLPLVLVAAIVALDRRALPWRLATRIGTAVAVLAVLLHGEAWGRVTFMARTPERYADVWANLQQSPPADAFWPGETVPPSVRYLRACTHEDDRVLVTLWAPQVFTFANRGFAGGHSYLVRRSYYSPHHQRKMVKWLRNERAPVALLNDEVLRDRFDLLQFYLDQEYEIVGTDVIGNEAVAVAIRRDTTSAGVDAETGWPCLR